MYQSAKFKAGAHSDVLEFMNKNPFITLIGYDGTFPVATQVPVQIDMAEDGKIILTGHVMKNTDHYRVYLSNPNVLALFAGPHTYVSAAVYAEPAVASTWNYMTVHAKGKIKMLDPGETYEVIRKLTDQYEDKHSSPAAFHKMDDAYVQKLIKAIAGFELEVEDLNHVFKLSQNHSRENQEAVIEQLSGSGDADALKIADAMKGK